MRAAKLLTPWYLTVRNKVRAMALFGYNYSYFDS